jgi:hypothetical protein
VASTPCEAKAPARTVRPKDGYIRRFSGTPDRPPRKGDDEIKALLRKANIARFEAPFLLADEPTIQLYLEELCKQVTGDVIGNIMYLDAMKEQVPAIKNDPQVVKAFAERAARLGAAKLDIPDRHLRTAPTICEILEAY